MFWKWTSLIFFLTTVLLGSFFISNYYSFKNYRNKGKVTRSFEKKLDLDEKQKEQFKKINEDYRTKMKDIRKEHRKLVEQLDMYTVSLSDNSIEAKKISEEIVKTEVEMRNLTIDFFFDLKSILNKEQKESMRKIFKEKKKFGSKKMVPPPLI